jgi:hypothetical protein
MMITARGTGFMPAGPAESWLWYAVTAASIYIYAAVIVASSTAIGIPVSAAAAMALYRSDVINELKLISSLRSKLETTIAAVSFLYRGPQGGSIAVEGLI